MSISSCCRGNESPQQYQLTPHFCPDRRRGRTSNRYNRSIGVYCYNEVPYSRSSDRSCRQSRLWFVPFLFLVCCTRVDTTAKVGTAPRSFVPFPAASERGPFCSVLFIPRE